MDKVTVIFTGRSGSGKGTQAKCLVDYLKEVSDRPTVYFETGPLFRAFAKNEGYTQSLLKRVIDTGGLAPSFIAVYFWSTYFVERMREDCHLVMDGAPRLSSEGEMLENALAFYGRSPDVMHIDISRDEAFARMSSRGREDDKDPDYINKRLDWYDKDVVPLIEFFKKHKSIRYHRVDGERDVDAIQAEIRAILSL